MNLLLLNLLLAGAWMAATTDVSFPNAVLGFVLGYAALWLTTPLYGDTGYFLRGWRAVRLAGFFLYALVDSSLRVAWDVILPRDLSVPGVIAVPLEAKTDIEIFFTANLISLTPGTLSIDVPPGSGTLYIHAMFLNDPEATIREAKRMEQLVLEVLR